MQKGSQDVEDIADEPYNDELHGEGVGAASLKVLDDLRGEDDDCQALDKDLQSEGNKENLPQQAIETEL